MSKDGQRLQYEGSRLQVVVAGGAAGLISRLVIAPLDVVKIRMQLQSHSHSPSASGKKKDDPPHARSTAPPPAGRPPPPCSSSTERAGPFSPSLPRGPVAPILLLAAPPSARPQLIPSAKETGSSSGPNRGREDPLRKDGAFWLQQRKYGAFYQLALFQRCPYLVRFLHQEVVRAAAAT